MSMPQLVPQDAQTVAVRVQVIDVEPFALDLVVPTYIPAKDLTQRVARDAGLGAYWEDGTRRLFWIRARGRVMGDDEKLQDLGVVQNELLHLLPQPPANSGVLERPPEYPAAKGYAGAGWVNVLGSVVLLFVWTGAWASVLTLAPTLRSVPAVLAGFLPGLGLALLSTSFSRHLWGGHGSSVRIPLTGFVVTFALMAIAAVPAVVLGSHDVAALAKALGPAVLAGLFGVLQGWLAWYGAVEPLPKATIVAAASQQQAAAQVASCGICGQAVTPEVRADCMFKCGRVFHSGCYKARQSMVGNDSCAVCGFRPGAA
jgi:uncharacterized ubiquitin-like protein YukD